MGLYSLGVLLYGEHFVSVVFLTYHHADVGLYDRAG